MSELIPSGTGSSAEMNEVVDKFQAMVHNGEVKNFIIIGVDTQGMTIVAQYVDNIIEGFGLLKVGELTIANSLMDGEEIE